MKFRVIRASAGALIAVLPFAACGDPAPRAATIEAKSARSQTAEVGSTIVATAPFVQVTDSKGNPVAGFPVAFTVFAGGGSLAATLDTTDADGIARSQRWTLGNAPGPNTVKAEAFGLAGSPITFEAIGVEGAVTSMQAETSVIQQGVVNTAVAQAPTVRLRDGSGNPVVGVSVSFEVTSGGGSLSRVSAITDDSGIASVEGWTLGKTAATNVMRARYRDRGVSFFAAAQAGPPVAMAVLGQPGEAYSTKKLGWAPSVGMVDQFGNKTNATGTVTAQIISGSVTLSGTTSLPLNGEYVTFSNLIVTGIGDATLSFSAPGLGSVVSAPFTVRKPAVRLKISREPVAQEPGDPLGVNPQILVVDEDDQTVPIAVGVTVSIASGDGEITSGADGAGTGVVNFSGVVLRGMGTFTLAFTSPGLIGATSAPFSTLPLVPARALVMAGDRQAAMVSSTLRDRPKVLVVNRAFYPIAGAVVSFGVQSGGGSIVGSGVTTDAKGFATAGDWTLGSTAGPNTVRATISGAPNAVPGNFTAVGCEGGGTGFRITLCPTSALTTSQRAAFAAAAAKWESIITNDPADVSFLGDSLPAGYCGEGSFALPAGTVIDDLVIFASVVSIDGPGGILGGAGPCLVRLAGPIFAKGDFPAVGAMIFDAADVESLESKGQLESVFTHEMGHVIGIGSLWDVMGLLKNPSPVLGPSLDTYFAGQNAISAFNAVGGAAYAFARVPVENSPTAGAGSINAHWREAVLRNELMTPYLDAGAANPLSLVTVRSLEDLGYTVNVGAADPFAFMSGGAVASRIAIPLLLIDDVRTGPIFGIDRFGRRVRIR